MAMHSTPGIQFDGVSKNYGAVKAVRGIDLQIAPGETVALLGPNGAGKSTAIDMMLGLAMPDAGSVRVYGDDPRHAAKVGRIGGMLQLGGLIPFLKVRELIASVAALYPNPLSVNDVIAMTAITDFAGRFTNKLSGGQIQRARFAMALVANTDLLILDEPTVAMDVEGRREFWTTMRGVAASGKTVVFATHSSKRPTSTPTGSSCCPRAGSSPTVRAPNCAGWSADRSSGPPWPGAGVRAARPGRVNWVELHGDAVILSCSDSDATVRELFANYPTVRNISVSGAGLEAAFVQLTGDREREAVR